MRQLLCGKSWKSLSFAAKLHLHLLCRLMSLCSDAMTSEPFCHLTISAVHVRSLALYIPRSTVQDPQTFMSTIHMNGTLVVQDPQTKITT